MLNFDALNPKYQIIMPPSSNKELRLFEPFCNMVI